MIMAGDFNCIQQLEVKGGGRSFVKDIGSKDLASFYDPMALLTLGLLAFASPGARV